MPPAAVFAHESVKTSGQVVNFKSVIELTREIFNQYDGLLYICPCGVVARALAANIGHKKSDPAVVVSDVGARYAISLLSGHEGGANRLAVETANILQAEPIITTTTEAEKNLIVGIGCRLGAEAGEIRQAIHQAVRQAGYSLKDVRLLASADLKRHEQGLLTAAEEEGIPLRFIAAEGIRDCQRNFANSEFVTRKVNLPAVAEPTALLAGSRTKLILPKTIINQITVAIARENCSS